MNRDRGLDANAKLATCGHIGPSRLAQNLFYCDGRNREDLRLKILGCHVGSDYLPSIGIGMPRASKGFKYRAIRAGVDVCSDAERTSSA